MGGPADFRADSSYRVTFEGALFECVADGCGSETIEEDDDVVRLMSRRLYKQPPVNPK
jgi:hypothetical protein